MRFLFLALLLVACTDAALQGQNIYFDPKTETFISTDANLTLPKVHCTDCRIENNAVDGISAETLAEAMERAENGTDPRINRGIAAIEIGRKRVNLTGIPEAYSDFTLTYSMIYGPYFYFFAQNGTLLFHGDP